MKSLIPVLIVLLLLTSCSEKTYCWQCEVTLKADNSVISTTDYCDKTVKDIILIEQEGTNQIFTTACFNN
jgi:hypothetical protein